MSGESTDKDQGAAETEPSSPSRARERSKRPPLPRPLRWLREAVALCFWTAIATQLLVFDLASWVATRCSFLEWVFRYRGLFVLGLAVGLLIPFGKRTLKSFALYVIAYPFIVLFWYIPVFAVKRWSLAIAFLPAFHTLFRSFRYEFIAYSLAIIAGVCVLNSENTWVIGGAMILLGGVLCGRYCRQIKNAFCSHTVFSRVSDSFTAKWDSTKMSKLFVQPSDIKEGEEGNETGISSELLSSYLLTSVFAKVAKEIRNIAESRKCDLYLVTSILFTLLLTLTVYALIYLGLDKLNPLSFEGEHGMGDYMSYSLCVLTTSNLTTVVPGTSLASTLSLVELLSAILISVFLLFLVMTSLREKYRSDISRVATELESMSNDFDQVFVTHYDKTLRAVEQLLLAQNDKSMRFALGLRYPKHEVERLLNDAPSTKEGSPHLHGEPVVLHAKVESSGEGKRKQGGSKQQTKQSSKKAAKKRPRKRRKRKQATNKTAERPKKNGASRPKN